MNESIALLEQFITDFDLRSEDGVTSFRAKIHFFTNSRLTVFEANIQIITSASLATLYIVSPENIPPHLPDMFDAKHNEFVYLKHQSLKIKPIDTSEKFTLSVFPDKS